MKKKNFKYFLLFLLSMTVVAGVYMLANRFMFYPVMAIYQIISLVSVCVYMYLYMSENTRREKETKSLPYEQAKALMDKRSRRMKIYVALFLPFVVTVLCDYTYLLLLSEQEWFVSLMNMFN